MPLDDNKVFLFGLVVPRIEPSALPLMYIPRPSRSISSMYLFKVTEENKILVLSLYFPQ